MPRTHPVKRREFRPSGGVASEAELCRFIENVRDYAIYQLDESGRIATWNMGAALMYGYSAEEILHRDVAMLYPAEDVRRGVPASALRSAGTEGSFAAAGWGLRKDSTRFWANVQLTAVRSDTGDLRGFGAITRESSRESRIAERLIGSVIESLQSHVAVIDSSGIVVMVNEAWNSLVCDSSVHSLEKASVGVNYLDVCRHVAVTEPAAAKVLEGLESILRKSLREFTLEYRCPRPTGDRWFVLSATPLRMDGGGIVIVHTDVTERVAAEQKLKGSEEHYRALIENEVDVVTIVDRDGFIRFESPALQRILGYEPEELIGKSAFNFFHPADVPVIKEELARVLTTADVSRPVEYRFRHKDGSWRVLESVARNLLTNPAVRGIIVNSRDITQRRKAEAELKQKDAALERSHEQLQALTGRLLGAEESERRRLSRELHDDLNQKLAVLAVDVGALAKSVTQSEPHNVCRELRSIQKRVARVSQDVRTMAYQLHPSILDDLGLAVALRSHCTEFSRREKIDVKFVHRNMHDPVSPELASCIYRVTQEALRNVAKHSRAKHATVSLVRLRSHLNLSIRDEGVGFVWESMRPRRGLGLTSMAERARLIGGEFRIVSAAGEGTTVKLRIPLEVDSE